MWLDLAQATRTIAAALSLGLVATCSSRGTWKQAPQPSRVSEAAPQASLSGAPVAPAPSASAAPAPAPAAARSTEPESLPLGKFYAALTASAQAQRDDHVRVLWLGDSHTAADYMTDRVRRGLQERFGAGGPGFVRVGLANYRHAGLKVSREGKWRIEPHPPARRSRQDDGVFGLGGLRAVGEPPARARLELTGGEREGPLGKVRYELLYDVAPGGSIELSLGEKRELAGADQGSPPIRRFAIEGDAAKPLELSVQRGPAKVWGVIVERVAPGVVLDTLGIDGARIATALAWDRDAFVREVAARKPDLAVVAYGTNEAFDNASAARYAGELAELVGRLRAAKPGLDCVIVAPPDAGTRDGGSPERLGEIEGVQREAARALGCGFFSQRAFMGGAGSFWVWLRETPPLARPDRLHYSPKGYERLGEGFVNRLLAAYDESPR